MRLVVADTGPLLHLSEIQSGELLLCFGSVQATPIVPDEFARHWPEFVRAALPSWLTAVSVSIEATDLANQWLSADLLDVGEAEALAHAKVENADLFLTDDAAARTLADSRGLSRTLADSRGLSRTLADSRGIDRRRSASRHAAHSALFYTLPASANSAKGKRITCSTIWRTDRPSGCRPA
jgi:predicted nucleic acid-binding protein